MQFVSPMPFEEAVQKLGSKSLIGSTLNSEQWAEVPVALRDRAFFSSQVESARVLQRGRDGINDFLSGNRETLDNGQVALKTGSRQQFVDQMQAFLHAEGIERTTGGLTDLTSERRLGLIFDTQVRQAQDFGNWKQGMAPDALDAFPAQRFIRVEDVSEPRDDHVHHEGEVQLKSDTGFWSAINRDFGVPWGPWGWGCGHDVEDVDREEAEALGLVRPGEVVAPVDRDFNDGLEASLRGIDPDMRARLKQSFGDQVNVEGDAVVWQQREVEPAPGPAPVTTPAPQPPPPTPVPPAPVPVSGATLANTLVEVGLKATSPTNSTTMRALREALKEENPLKSKDVLKSLTGAKKTGVLTPANVHAAVSELLSFLPPDVANALPKLNIEIKRLKGANGTYWKGKLQLDSRINSVDDLRRVVFHEMAHWRHLDGDAAYKKVIKDHFVARTQGEPVAHLSGYSTKTRGKKDKWFDSYAGRIYDGLGDTGEGWEVPTRYMEWLSKPAERLADMWNSDREFRETFLVVLKGLF